MRQLIKKLLLIDLIKGLLITLKTIFTHPVTIRYPKQKREITEGFRGRHALVRDPETGKERCVACLRCVRVCPSQCIRVEYTEDPTSGARVLTKYEIEAFRCIYCAYCVEVCPVNAIVLTEYYEYAVYDKEENYFTKDKLLQNWDEFIAGYKGDSYLNKFWYLKGIERRRLPFEKRFPKPINVKMEAKQ
ncbi:NADH-quinone oxidoreductase subunit NuoI [Thermodesulfobacterium sp. TA1]|uniref:NADH-quinone oxidoreductase subunit NuoI n=1 Tax=Thermodesulfobacterium sp. TA1 TaxID=2234087 RepID=UPI0012328EC3|nr:NADH-quinone oxidoreductase subunit NuoI [Thermodesulfobacterium sp. TA1]QER42651.1 NADH-quinone oxidoreductase subunit NuoI [Thermodesulfobacterium sp. TA1]